MQLRSTNEENEPMDTLVDTAEAESGEPIWRHARWFEPHPAKPRGMDRNQPTASQRVSDGCQTCHEVLVAYCPDCFTGEPHACPYLIEKNCS